jgi:YVTN family beta-propeller protein
MWRPRKVVRSINLGESPAGVYRSPDGKKLYVANGRSNTVSVVDTERLEKVRDIKVGDMPWGVYIPEAD